MSRMPDKPVPLRSAMYEAALELMSAARGNTDAVYFLDKESRLSKASEQMAALIERVPAELTTKEAEHEQ